MYELKSPSNTDISNIISYYLILSINSMNPIYPEYIDLKLLKYFLSVGSNVACRLYFNNTFHDCIVQASEIGTSFSDITNVETTSKFKIIQSCKNTLRDHVIYISLKN